MKMLTGLDLPKGRATVTEKEVRFKPLANFPLPSFIVWYEAQKVPPTAQQCAEWGFAMYRQNDRHGNGKYVSGCRCDLCRAVRAANARVYRARRAAKGPSRKS